MIQAQAQGNLNDYLNDLDYGYDPQMRMISLQQYFNQQRQDYQQQVDYNRLFQEIVDQSSIRNQLDRSIESALQFQWKKEEFQYVNKPFAQKKERGNSAGGISIIESRDLTPSRDKIKNHRSNSTIYQNRSSSRNNSIYLKKNHYLLKTTVKQENQDKQQKARYTSYDQSCFRLQKDYKDLKYSKEADMDYSLKKSKKDNNNNLSDSNANFENDISNMQSNNLFHQKKYQNTFESLPGLDQQIDNLSDDLSASEYDQLLIDQDQIEKYEKTRMHLKNLVMNKWEKSNEKKSKFVDNPQDYLRQLDTLQWAKSHKKDRQKSFNRYKQLVECMEFDKDGNPISKQQKEQDTKQAKKHYAPEFIKRIMDITQLNSLPRQNWAKLNNKLFVTKALMKNLSVLSRSSQEDSKEDQVQKAQEDLANRLDMNDDCLSVNNENTPTANQHDLQNAVIARNNNNILKQSLSIFSQRSQQKNTISSKISQEKENFTFTSLTQQQWQQQQQNKQQQKQKLFINLLNQKQDQPQQKRVNKFQSLTPAKELENRANSHHQSNVTPIKNRPLSQKQQLNNKLQNSNSGSVNNTQKIQYRNTHQEVIKGLDQIINELTGGNK